MPQTNSADRLLKRMTNGEEASRKSGADPSRRHSWPSTVKARSAHGVEEHTVTGRDLRRKVEGERAPIAYLRYVAACRLATGRIFRYIYSCVQSTANYLFP